MSKKFYRFRRIENLLGRKELESQEIYFSDIESLNDPMEGFHNLYWQGDSVLWKCLFRNYLICLIEACYTIIESKGTVLLKESDITTGFHFDEFIQIQRGKEQLVISNIIDNFFLMMILIS